MKIHLLPRSIGARFAVASIALVLLAGAPLGFVAVKRSFESDQEALLQKSAAILEYLEWTLQFDMEMEDGVRIQEQLESMSHIKEAQLMAVLTQDGFLLSNWVREGSALDENPLILEQSATSNEGEPLGILRMEIDTAQIRADRADLIGTILTFAAIFLTAVGLVGFFLGSQLSKNLKRLAVTAESLSQGNLGARAHQGAGDEVGVLAKAFNRMAKRIEQREGQLEEAKVEAEKNAEIASSAEHAKGKFLATMTHEIRTPMNGLLGMTDLLLETELDAEQQDLTTTMQDSGRSLLTILNDILDFSKIEAGKIDFESIDFDLDDLVEDTLSLFVAKGHERGLQLGATIAPNLPNTFIGDPGRLRQILSNMLGNALKFTAIGSVQIHVKWVADMGKRTLLRFEVADTGRGISDKERSLLFQPFQQAESSTTREYGGTGLGLAICKEFVSLLGGDVGVDSVLGEGSTFWFTVPLPVAEKQRPRPDPTLGNKRTLTICADESGPNSVDEKLSRRGVPNTRVRSIADALQVLHSPPSDGIPWTSVVVDHKIAGRDLAATRNALLEVSRDLTLVLVTDHDRFDATNCKPWGSVLVRPIHSRKLWRALDDSAQSHSSTAAKTPMKQAAESLPSLKVLVVDDNLVNRKVARLTLEKMGCRVVTANDGLEGANIAAEHDLDLIFMDVQMPVMDGIQSTSKIRQLAAGRGQVPIYMLSANAVKSIADRAVQAGANGFVSKPLQLNEILAVLQSVANALPENWSALET